MQKVSPEGGKKAYGIYMSPDTYNRFKQAYYQKRAENKEIKTYDDFINYLIQKDQVPTY
jgi:hypothetical protein